MDSHISLDGASDKRFSISVQATDAEKQQVVDYGQAVIDEKITKLRQFMVGWFFSHHAKEQTIESDEPFIHLCPKCHHETQYFVRPLDDYILSLCLATPCLKKVMHSNEEEEEIEEDLTESAQQEPDNTVVGQSNMSSEICSVESNEINGDTVLALSELPEV